MNNILFSRAIFYRNLKDYKFVPKLTKEKQQEIVAKLQEVLAGFRLIDLANMDEKTTQYLNKNYLLNKNVKNIFVDDKNGVFICLFDGEHIQICATSFDYGKQPYKKVKEIADMLANTINLAYADNYGYLMSDITKIGTGLKFESEISLPCIVELGKIEQIKQNLKKLGYILSETNLNKVYKLSTLCNLGLKEKEILEDFEKMLKKLQDIEIESAKMLDIGAHDEITDKAMRSLAILKSAYLLTNEELHSLLTNIRTGLNLNILEIDLNKINKLQILAYNKNLDFISQSELKKLASKAQEILKGESNV